MASRELSAGELDGDAAWVLLEVAELTVAFVVVAAWVVGVVVVVVVVGAVAEVVVGAATSLVELVVGADEEDAAALEGAVEAEVDGRVVVSAVLDDVVVGTCDVVTACCGAFEVVVVTDGAAGDMDISSEAEEEVCCPP